MPEVTWLRGDGGAVMSFAGQLPPFAAQQVAKGELTVLKMPADPGPGPERVTPAEPPADPAPAKPQADAPKASWEAYAVAQGMSRSRARKTAKADLVRHYSALRAVG